MAENHIIVGLGGTGGKVLRTFKMRMFEEFPKFEERQKQSVALLYVDTTMEMMGIGRDDFNVRGRMNRKKKVSSSVRIWAPSTSASAMMMTLW